LREHEFSARVKNLERRDIETRYWLFRLREARPIGSTSDREITHRREVHPEPSRAMRRRTIREITRSDRLLPLLAVQKPRGSCARAVARALNNSSAFGKSRYATNDERLIRLLLPYACHDRDGARSTRFCA